MKLAIEKRLFTSSPGSLRQGTRCSERAPSPRDPLGDHYDIWGYKRDGHAAIKKPRVGFCGAMILYNNDQYVPINMFQLGKV